MKKLLYLFLVFGLFACSSDSEDDDSDNSNPCPNQPQLITYEVSNINIDENTDLVGATFTAEIQNIQLGADCETFSITNQGFVYGTSIQSTISNNVINANGQNASATVNNLLAETTYYVRAYLTNTLGTFYGNEVSFTTPQSTVPVYLDDNGVTVKARDWAEIGMTGQINGITYTIVDEEILDNMIDNGEDLTAICTSKILEFCQLNLNSYNNPPYFNQDISSWDVSNAWCLTGMFFGCIAFDQDISNWDTSNVTHMKHMFINAESFNQDISSWDVSNVVNMDYMFKRAYLFNQPLNDWETSNVESMHNMFWDATSFNQPLNDWDVINVTTMYEMFWGAHLYNQDLSSWDISNVSSCQNFCRDATSWTLPKPNFSNCGDIGCD